MQETQQERESRRSTRPKRAKRKREDSQDWVGYQTSQWASITGAGGAIRVISGVPTNSWDPTHEFVGHVAGGAPLPEHLFDHNSRSDARGSKLCM